MRFLIDNALSPLVAQELREHGHDAVHVRDVGLHAASDRAILDHAAEGDRILVSADTDFGALLALRELAAPSVILFRRETGRSPRAQIDLLLANLEGVKAAAMEGSVIVFDENRIRVRRLPIGNPDQA